MLAEITKLRAGKPTAIRVTTYYNSEINDAEAPAGPEFQAFYVKELIRFNAAICRAAKAGGAICVDLLPAFNRPDGTRPADQFFLHAGNVHFNQDGQALIARTIAGAGFAPFQ